MNRQVGLCLTTAQRLDKSLFRDRKKKARKDNNWIELYGNEG